MEFPDYFEDDDALTRSPGLEPWDPSPKPTRESLNYASFWLPRDLQDAPLNPEFKEHEIVYVHHDAGDSLNARKGLHEMFDSQSPAQAQFSDALLLHQMAPNNPQLTLALVGLGSANSSVESLTLGNARKPNLVDSSTLQVQKQQLQDLRQEQKKEQPPKFGPTEHRILVREMDTHLPPISDSQQFRPTQFLQDESIRLPSRIPAKTRLGLPITLHTSDTLATVLACADTGADVNIISHDLARGLGHTSYETLREKKEFSLANGKILEAIGKVNALCSFGIETEISFSMQCVFYVLHKVATPIIMGMGFLTETETMTKHRERLVRVPRPAFQALSVCSINTPRKLVACQLDRRETLATADSGAEIDLMSSSFASERGLIVYNGKEKVEMADGSIAITSGFVQAQLAVNHTDHLKSKIATVDFFLLDNLVHDLIVGENSLDEFEIFTTNRHALVDAPITVGPLGLNRIRHLGAIDRITKWIKSKILGSSSRIDIDDATACRLNNLQEIDRREREAARIAALPLDEQDVAIQEEIQRQNDYTSVESIPVPVPSSGAHLTPPMGLFKCEFPECNAAPFQTQYLLNSHFEVHDPSRSHFCPIADCPRGEGGKGFKSKNEMIRHGLVHQSPGYVCPFCPDREHKYPRPDNLQRHVRVHHVDIEKNDVRLREELAQRPEGWSRGRRRRLGFSMRLSPF